MGWSPFRRAQLTDDELRDALFKAVAASDVRTVKNLAHRHFERVVKLFPTWKTFPSAVRSDPGRTTFWAEGLIGVASTVAALGDGSLMMELQGPPETNPVISWQKALLTAQANTNAGEYLSAIKILEQALEDTKGLVGSGVHDLLPKTYGLLGLSFYRAGNIEQARACTLKAKELCIEFGDDEGAEIYSRNLAAIVAQSPH